MKPPVNPLPKLKRRTRPLRWLFLGDSITLGATHTHGWRDYTQIFAERVRNEMRRSGDLVLNAATDGATSAACLTGLKEVLPSYRPDMSLVMIGVNDCAADRRIPRRVFTANLRAIATLLRETGSRVILQTPNSLIKELAAPYRRRFDGIVDEIRQVAASENLALVDHEKHWKTLFAGTSPSRAVSYLCDGIHPNGFGHALLAAHLFRSLGIFDPKSPTCRSFTPHSHPLPQLQRPSKQ